jgi:hypothetical protein
MTQIEIDMLPASAYDRASYGITHRSTTLHRITGSGVHSRSHNHEIQAWDNTRRPRSEGKYESPDGKLTTSEISYLTSAVASVISARPVPGREVAETLKVGDKVTLRFLDTGNKVTATVTERPLADPDLVPVVSDTQIVDTLAALLAVSEWDGGPEDIAAIADLIGKVRPHPGNCASRAEYAAAFKAATGRDVPNQYLSC